MSSQAIQSQSYCKFRNEEMVTLQRKNVSPYQVSAAGEPYLNFRLIFRKTNNKDPTNSKQFTLETSRQTHE